MDGCRIFLMEGKKCDEDEEENMSSWNDCDSFLGGCNNANVPQATVSVEEHQQDISEQENMEAGIETINQTSQESRLGKM